LIVVNVGVCEEDRPQPCAAGLPPAGPIGNRLWKAHLALKTADRAYVMETGRITMEGKGRDLLGDPAIRAAYLGE